MAERVVPQFLAYGQWSPITIEGEVAYIALGGGLEAIIDATDVRLVEKEAWRATFPSNGIQYAAFWGEFSRVFLHRLLMPPPQGLSVDHINGNPLDNRRSNLRVATHAQNMANRKSHKNNTSGFRGVYRAKNRYRAEIKHQGKKIRLGSFATAEEAGAAYSCAAKELFGEFFRSEP